LHFIGADGNKRFLHDGKIDGNFHSLGDVKTSGRLWVAEGYATAATVHELTSEPVMAACNAGNLQAVAVALHERYPGAEMVIAADSDRLTKHNPGLTKALSAARDIDGKVAVPWFLDVSRKPTDWNDMMRSDGKELTRRALMGSVMTPERYIERTRQKDLTWALHAEDNGWSREVVQRGIAQRTQERGFNRERSIGHER
jgi:putative DNA primase/helicase